ncbi:extracellular solute-binding protein [Salinispirillum marinum]|uniref:Extracellular solute-binding protein n=2 Tax=Saccharospirillaceae TaxID=255527 RepID=A0ABV8BDK7_9GAMM
MSDMPGYGPKSAKTMLCTILLSFVLLATFTFAAPLSVACGATHEVCQWLGDQYQRQTGEAITVDRLSSGEVLQILEAHINAVEKPYDVWWGGTGDTHLKAVESGLLERFEPDNLAQQLRWSRQFWQQSSGHSVGVYAGTLAIVSNLDVLVTKNLTPPQCWSDLGDPRYRSQIIIADPSLSGTSFLFIGTVLQLFDDVQGERLLSEIQQNTQGKTGSGYDALQRVIQGNHGVTVAFVHDVLPLLADNPQVVVHAPCEGTGYEIGAASVVKGTMNYELSNEFIEFTLSHEIQNQLVGESTFQMFSNINSAPSPVYENREYLNVINYDFITYSSDKQRHRMINLWQE